MKKQFLFFALVFAGISSSGCVYFHDQARQNAAEEAKASFEESIKKGNVSKAVASYDAEQSIEDELVETFHRTDDTTQLIALLSTPWSDLVTFTTSEKNIVEDAIPTTEAKKNQLKTELKKSLEDLPGVKAEKKKVVDALNQAAMQEGRYLATQKLLGESLLVIADDKKKASLVRLNELLDTTVPVKKYKDENGQLVEDTSDQKKLGTILKMSECLKSTPEANQQEPRGQDESAKMLEFSLKCLPKIKDKEAFSLEDPGIATTILGLAFDLARAEEERIQVKVNATLREIGLYDEQIAFLNKHNMALTDDLNENGLGVRGVAPLASNPETPVREVLEQQATNYQLAHNQAVKATNPSDRKKWIEEKRRARGNMQAAYMALARYYENVIVNSKKRIEFDDRMANWLVKKSLATSEANLREREAVILRGLQGLVAFHQGGITSEDIANIIRIAQTAGIFYIAGVQ